MYGFIYLSRAPRFNGYQQQDSQELLRYLLDSLRAEEIFVCAQVREFMSTISALLLLSLQRIKRAILTAFNIGKKEPSALSKLTDKDRADIKSKLVSMVTAQKCNTAVMCKVW